MDILGNTFLGRNRHNYELRGYPCFDTDFHSNVSLESEDDALIFKNDRYQIFDSVDHINVASTPNQFQSSDPTVRLGAASLGVGDFDGDGADDLFLATGYAWYYSPAGAREWRFLSAKADTIEQQLFGDFDGDGRTDVVALRGGQFMVSWGGVSDWEVHNPDPTGGNLLLLPSAITAMAVGDFDGDGHADVFWADGQTWWVSYGGNTPFVEVQTSSHRVKDLRFGDFDGNGTTDVFSVVSDGVSLRWMVSYSRKSVQGLFSSWTLLRSKLTDTVDGLIVADFGGSGKADVATNCGADAPGCWRISYGGLQDWRYYTLGTFGPYVAGVGHFLGQVEADLLSWDNLPFGPLVFTTEFSISMGGISPLTRYSTQDMR